MTFQLLLTVTDIKNALRRGERVLTSQGLVKDVTYRDQQIDYSVDSEITVKMEMDGFNIIVKLSSPHETWIYPPIPKKIFEDYTFISLTPKTIDVCR